MIRAIQQAVVPPLVSGYYNGWETDVVSWWVSSLGWASDSWDWRAR